VLSRIKIVGRMDIAEKRRPQDGRLKTRNPDGKEVELRLSTMPTAFGEKLVIRIFNPETLLVTAEGLGFSGKEVALWKDMATQPYGILLVTGPTGSGKTTTLYSTLKWLAQPDVNVCTIEDPIELVDPAFNQMQVQHGINLDFASGVRTLLRQDPDIIMIGEIRDYETAEMAIQAALTGHLVLSTLHTNDAPSAVTRLIELGVPPYLINSTLIGVMAQRLLRTLCSQCKTPHQVTAQSWEQFVIPWKVPMPRHLASTGGCLICRNTGYHGRTAIAEIMRISESIKQLIVPQADAALIKKRAIAEGMVPLRMSGARKVIQGLTTMEEVARTTPGK
jgi:general secretion pathway protein E